VDPVATPLSGSPYGSDHILASDTPDHIHAEAPAIVAGTKTHVSRIIYGWEVLASMLNNESLAEWRARHNHQCADAQKETN
jgi:hypothetical protein